MRIEPKLAFLVAIFATSLMTGCKKASSGPSCNDGFKNGMETDVDCGGGCGPCSPGKACAKTADCASGLCTNSVCEALSTCSDKTKDGKETDVDCGGGVCLACKDGLACIVASDCAGGVCKNSVCQAPSCTDGIKNGDETGLDCGGSCPRCLPPDPAKVAPVLETTVATNMADATSFIYEGPNPLQVGVTPGAIEKHRVAVLRGHVRDQSGTDISEVSITILGHPEYGQTLTRKDGQFDIAVSGGGRLTVVFVKTDYHAANRTLDVPWLDYVAVPEIVMVQQDPAVSSIDVSGNSGAIQVARGSPVKDADGTRQATIFIPPKTRAVLRMPDGSTKPASMLHIHATEFTVGANGPQAMPADLPASSAYTYDVEINAEEEATVGATGVEFSQPVFLYVENFLRFPAGTPAPNGHYDSKRAVWVADQSGFVLTIVSITAGAADIDTHGDGKADDAATLATLGVTPQERAQLANLYKSGQSLFRVPISQIHQGFINPGEPFSLATSDVNYPTVTAVNPGDKFNPFTGTFIHIDPPDPSFDFDNHALRRSVGIVGTPFSLNYRSDRVPGLLPTLNIPVIDGTSHPGLKSIDLTISIAGRTEKKHFVPGPVAQAQNELFTWDRKDAYGRTVAGRQRLGVRRQLNFDATFVATSKFGDPPNACSPGDTSCKAPPKVVAFETGRNQISFLEDSEMQIGQLDGRSQGGLGGWTISVHHIYDPVGKVLYLGTGEVRAAENLLQIIKTVAGGGGDGHTLVDEVPATETTLTNGVGNIDVARDGSLFISTAYTVHKVDPKGIIHYVAGSNDTTFPSDDGHPAARTRMLIGPIAVGSDDTLYVIADNKIRHVKTDGTVETVAGNGVQGFSGDGGPAIAAQLSDPRSICFAKDGSLYIADRLNRRIRRVGTDGIISTAAGNGSDFDFHSPPPWDGAPAIVAPLPDVNLVACAPDGSVYFNSNFYVGRIKLDGTTETVAGLSPRNSADGSDIIHFDVRQGVADIKFAPDGSWYFGLEGFGAPFAYHVLTNGIVNRVAGNGTSGLFAGDAGPATQASLASARSIALHPDGSLLIADHLNFRVRKVGTPLPGYNTQDILIASEDGNAVYRFDKNGRHLATLHALTGAALSTFAYDSSGNLKTITDGDGDVTTIERDNTGNPTAIVGPYGQRTKLTVDGDGFLASASDPAGSKVEFTSKKGLITSITDPNGNTSTFRYDGQGRPAGATDALGASSTITRTDLPSGADSFSLHFTSPAGVQSEYDVAEFDDGKSQRLTVYPDGTRQALFMGTDADFSTEPNGTISTSTFGPDPRFGMQAPLLANATVNSPRGLKSATQHLRTVLLANPKDPLSLVSQIDKVTVDARTSILSFDAKSLTSTTLTPESRKVTSILDKLGRAVQIESAGILPITTTRDDHGRVKSVTTGSGTDARNAVLTYGLDGYVASTTNPLGQTSSSVYDLAGRVIEATRADGQTIRFAYDKNGSVTSITPPGQPAHLYSYDGDNQLTVYTPPAIAGTGSINTSYDQDGRVQQITRPDATTIQKAYDSAGRLSTTILPGERISYAYDAKLLPNPNTPGNPPTGQLSSITSSISGRIAYTYDGAQVLSETWSGGLVVGSVEWSYDANMRLHSETVDGQSPIVYQFDKDNLLTRAGDLVFKLDSQSGLMNGNSLKNISTSISRNGFGEVITLSAAGPSGPLQTATYARDALGRVLSLQESLNRSATNTTEYTYDLVGRLTKVKLNGTLQAIYTYDPNGNRLTYTDISNTTIQGKYDNQDRLLQYGNTDYLYNANGELSHKTEHTSLGDQVTSYTFDARSNLTSVALSNGTTIDYLLDALGRRIGKKVNGKLTQGFLYSNAMTPAAELDANGVVVSRFVSGYVIQGGKSYSIITDHQGNVRLVVDTDSGDIKQQTDYDEFGNVIKERISPDFRTIPLGFSGGLYDRDTGLIQFGAREYDSKIGRWISKDPIGFGGGTNFYVYAGNDPINFDDLSGLKYDPQQAEKDMEEGLFDGYTGLDTGQHHSPAYYHGKQMGIALALTQGVSGAVKNALAKEAARRAAAKIAADLAAGHPGGDAAVKRLIDALPKTENGMFNFVIHGSNKTVGMEGMVLQNGRWASVGAGEVANLIRASGWTPGTDIQLLSCGGGRLSNGLAQNVASILNTNVRAATDIVTSEVNTVTGAVQHTVANQGWWVIFHP